MENKLIEIQDLQVGDEIITLSQQSKYLRVMEIPRKSKVGWSWKIGVDRFIAVKCQVNVDVATKQGTKWNYKTKTHEPYTYEVKTYNIKAPEENSPIEKFDLNFKDIWLVKRQ